MRAPSGPPPQQAALLLLLCLHCGYALGSAIPAVASPEEETPVAATTPATTVADTDHWSNEPPAAGALTAGGPTAYAGSVSSETSTSSSVDPSVPATASSASTTNVAVENITAEPATLEPDAPKPTTYAPAATTHPPDSMTSGSSNTPQRKPADPSADWTPFLGPDEECHPGHLFRVQCNFCICPVSGWRRHAQCSNRLCPTHIPPGRRRRFRRAPGNGERCAPNIRYMDECNLCICSADGIKAHSSCTFAQCPQKPR